MTIRTIAYKMNLQSYQVQQLIREYFPELPHKSGGDSLEEEQSLELMKFFNQDKELMQIIRSFEDIKNFGIDYSITFRPSEKFDYKKVYQTYLRFLKETVDLLYFPKKTEKIENQIRYNIDELKFIHSELLELRQEEQEKVNEIKLRMLTENDEKNSMYNNLD